LRLDAAHLSLDALGQLLDVYAGLGKDVDETDAQEGPV
jgi:hypothetical protein